MPRAVEALGPLTCLVNNASAFEMDKVDTATRESWDRHIETGLRAPLVLSQAFARQLPEDIEGNIINMLDQRVWKLTPYFLSYTVAKSGLWTLTQTLALALAPRIRVNGIGPGPTSPSERQTAEQFRLQQAAVPLKRGPAPEEIAATVRYILATPSLDGPDDRARRRRASGLGAARPRLRCARIASGGKSAMPKSRASAGNSRCPSSDRPPSASSLRSAAAKIPPPTGCGSWFAI